MEIGDRPLDGSQYQNYKMPIGSNDDYNYRNSGSHNGILKFIIILLVFIIVIGAIYIKNPSIINVFNSVTITIPAQLMDDTDNEQFRDAVESGKAIVKDNGDIEVTLNYFEYQEYKKNVKQAIKESIDELNNDKDVQEYIRKIEVNDSLTEASIYMSEQTSFLQDFAVSLYAIAISYELQIYDSILLEDNNIVIKLYDSNNKLLGSMDEKDLDEWINSLGSDNSDQEQYSYSDDELQKAIDSIDDKPIENSDSNSTNESEQSYNVINKGDVAHFATIDVTILDSYETKNINGVIDSAKAEEGTKYIIISLRVENTTKQVLTTPMDFVLVDDNDRQFTVTDSGDAFWALDNLEYYPELQPNVGKSLNILYTVPENSKGIAIVGAHADTGDLMILKIN